LTAKREKRLSLLSGPERVESKKEMLTGLRIIIKIEKWDSKEKHSSHTISIRIRNIACDPHDSKIKCRRIKMQDIR